MSTPSPHAKSPGSPSAPSAEDVAMATEVAKKATPGELKTREGTPLLTATLHKTHLVSVMGGDALSVAVENTETGDKFFTTISSGDLDTLIPEKLRAGGDIEGLADLEFLLLECLRAESCHAATTVTPQDEATAPDMFSKSQEIPARGKDAPFPNYEIEMSITNGLRGRKKTHTLKLSVPLVSASTVEDKAQIRFRKLKEGFEETVQELREEIELLRVQTNNRIFFGESHSVSRSSIKLKTNTFSESGESRIVYKTLTKIVAGRWTVQKNCVLAEPNQMNNPVELTMKLDMDFSKDGADGLAEREQFEKDVLEVLSTTTGISPEFFKIRKLSPGSSIVEADILPHPHTGKFPFDTARSLEMQVNDPSSKLRSGVAVECDDPADGRWHVHVISNGRVVNVKEAGLYRIDLLAKKNDGKHEVDSTIRINEKVVAKCPGGTYSQIFDNAQLDPDQLPQLSSDDLMPLKLCRELKCLHIHGNQVNHLNFLQGLTNLEELKLSATRVTDLSMLSHVTNLKTLHITGLELGGRVQVDTGPLEKIQKLEDISFNASPSIADAVSIGKLLKLKKLDLRGSGMTNRNPLAQPGLVIQ